MDSEIKIHKNKKFKFETLDKFFPETVEISKTIKVKKILRPSKQLMTTAELEQYFDNFFTALFLINGELSGQAICQFSHQALSSIPLPQEELVNLFIETFNIILGNFLTELDQKMNIFSQHNSPLIINSNFEKNSRERIKKIRVLNQVKKILEMQQFDKIDYLLNYSGKNYSFHILLLTHLNKVYHV